MSALRDIIDQHKSGKSLGIFSVCSSHPLVIEAAMRHAIETESRVLIEATSNQVNQNGGYTGMKPEDFRNLALNIADKVGLSPDMLILGGDHLGPNCWQDLPAEEAMQKSDILIDQYVRAGFKKIHLDCSMSCAGDPIPLDDETVASRAARLCAIAENAWQEVGGEAPVYIVGTEVPVPGGAHEELDELAVTTVDAATQTIGAHQTAFQNLGLMDVWPRVIGLVVQPGVEFDNQKVVDFLPEKATELSQFCESLPYMVFEAHSTDYQTEANLAALVRNHFAILKVGPGLTFAMREACWSLSDIESEYIAPERRSNLKSVLLNAMRENPKYWQAYYPAEGNPHVLECQFSLSDRIRYYWPIAEVDDALNTLIQNIDSNPPAPTLLSQFMPEQYWAVRKGEISLNAKELIFHKISEVLNQYYDACNQASSEISELKTGTQG